MGGPSVRPEAPRRRATGDRRESRSELRRGAVRARAARGSADLLRAAGRTRSTAATGAVTLIQRFGSAEQRSAQALVQRVAERIGSALERQGLLVQDCEQSYLALDPGKGEPAGDLLGHSITSRVAMGPRTGQKEFRTADAAAAAAARARCLRCGGSRTSGGASSAPTCSRFMWMHRCGRSQ